MILVKSDRKELESEISMAEEPEAKEDAGPISKTNTTSVKQQVVCWFDENLVNKILKNRAIHLFELILRQQNLQIQSLNRRYQ